MREQTIGQPLDSRARTTTITRFNFKFFFHVFSNNRHPGQLHCTSFLPKKISAVIVIEEG